jgi:rfaE bifunctional protein nucleotidyltransferase chain/domain
MGRNPCTIPSTLVGPSKLVGIDEAASQADGHRAAGRKVVLAHGVFDLLHIGHLRHLKLARQEGDVLIVSITADRFVNKGPGRPAFPEQVRAEMLAALDTVSLVVVSEAPTAVPMIEAIRPDIYIKGSEYAQEDKDVTGKIVDERLAVERGGGRIVFTDDVVHSSSSLINQFMDIHDPPLQDYLNRLRGTDRLADVLAALDKVADCRVLLVGDAILDEYDYVQPMGKSPKENMIATRFTGREIFAGGVFAAANHIASFCQGVDVVTCIGDDGYEDFIRSSLKPNVTLHAVRRPDTPTTRKSRFVEPAYVRKLFEVYHFDDAPLSESLQAEVDGLVARLAPERDLVVVADFGHGLISASTIDTFQRHARFLAVNAQSNSANQGFNLVTKYGRADYVCVDRPEVQLAMADRWSPLDQLMRGLSERIKCGRIMVTTGREGCIGFDREAGFNQIPGFTRSVVDTVGAGDAFLSVTSPLVARGVPLDVVGFVGNAAGAMKVGIVGHRQAIDKVRLIKYVTALLK